MRVGIARLTAVFAAVFIVGLSATHIVGAQSSQSSSGLSGNGFRISPVRSELSVEKGKKGTIAITIENPTDFATTARPVVNDFIASDKEDGEPRLILDNNVASPKNSFKSLVGVMSDVSLGPREKKDISVVVSVPSDASAGGYYGAVRFVPTQTANGGNVTLTASVGTIVLVTVPGNLTQKLNLVQFGAVQNDKFKGFITKGDVAIGARLKNAGDIHLQPFGKVAVKNMFGKTVKEYEINATSANVLPGSTRKYVDKIDNSRWFGRYTITANIGYAQGSGDLITAKASFWYVPTWALYVFAVLAAVIVGGVYFLVRKFTGGGRHKR